MATTGARRRPQKSPDELRERAVRMGWRSDARPARSTARSRVSHGSSVSGRSRCGTGWSRSRSTPVDSPGSQPADAQRIAQLERENRELRRANDILKAASVSSRPSSTVCPKRYLSDARRLNRVQARRSPSASRRRFVRRSAGAKSTRCCRGCPRRSGRTRRHRASRLRRNGVGGGG